MRHSSRLAASALLFSLVTACVGDDALRVDTVHAEPADAGDSASHNSGGNAGGNAGTATTTPDGGNVVTNDAGDAGSVMPAIDVRTLAGAKLWLESAHGLVSESAGSTGFGSWTDALGGTPHVVVPQNVNPPSIVANGFGGRPTVAFTAGNGYLKLPRDEAFQVGTGDFFIAVVAKINSGSGPLWSFRPNATAGSEQLLTPTGFCFAYGLGVTNGCTSAAAAPDTEAHVFMARRVSSLFDFTVDGTRRGSVDVGTNPAGIQIGQFAQDSVFIGGSVTMQVSELVLVVGPTPDATITQLGRELRAKYLIP